MIACTPRTPRTDTLYPNTTVVRSRERPVNGAGLDGRDIGKVICPDADVKFFLTASVEARAARRHKELLERGEQSIYARVLQDLRERDARDSGRATAPLKAAADAVRLATGEMDAERAFKVAKAELARRGLGHTGERKRVEAGKRW